MKRFLLTILAICAILPVFSQTTSPNSFLLSQARKGKTWAVEALANAYRSGKGKEKSIFNALFLYELAGKDIKDLCMETYQANNKDEMGLLFNLMSDLDTKDYSSILSQLDADVLENYEWAPELKWVVENRDREDLYDLITQKMTSTVSPDVRMVDAMGYMIIAEISPNNEKAGQILEWVAQAVPFFYNLYGENKLTSFVNDPDSEKDPAKLREATQYFHKAFEYGMLSPEFAASIVSDEMKKYVDISEFFTPDELPDLHELASKRPIRGLAQYPEGYDANPVELEEVEVVEVEE